MKLHRSLGFGWVSGCNVLIDLGVVMKNKTLAQILKPIAEPKFAQQRNHIYSQFKKMLAHGMSRETALTHAKFSVDSLIGNYDKITYDDLNRETVMLVRERNGLVEVIAVYRPPKNERGQVMLEMVRSRKKRKFPNVQATYERLRKSIYRRYPNTYFSDEKVFQAA